MGVAVSCRLFGAGGERSNTQLGFVELVLFFVVVAQPTEETLAIRVKNAEHAAEFKTAFERCARVNALIHEGNKPEELAAALELLKVENNVQMMFVVWLLLKIFVLVVLVVLVVAL